MKKLVIIRHAKSDRNSEVENDHDRPLSARGFSDAPLMGKWLAANSYFPDAVISSTALRARQTCSIICEAVHFNPEAVYFTPDFYFGEISKIIKMLQSLGREHDVVFIFGHNPTFSLLANVLCPDFETDMPTCGIAVAAFDTNDWNNIGAGKGQLEAFVYPKKIR